MATATPTHHQQRQLTIAIELTEAEFVLTKHCISRQLRELALTIINRLPFEEDSSRVQTFPELPNERYYQHLIDHTIARLVRIGVLKQAATGQYVFGGAVTERAWNRPTVKHQSRHQLTLVA